MSNGNKVRRGPMGGHGPMGGGEKAKDFKGTMKKLGVYLKPYSLSIAIVILFFKSLGPSSSFNGVPLSSQS